MRTLGILVIALGLTVNLLTMPIGFAAPAKAPKPLSPIQKEELQDQLKSSVSEAQNKLGAIEPWQKKIFDEEVLVDYGRFIKDYRSAGNNTVVDVDYDSLKKYLTFSGTKYFKKSDLKVLVFVHSDAECAKCMASLPILKKAIKARLERRGLAVVFLAAKPSEPFVLNAELEKVKDAVGVVQIQARQIVDEEHPDEDHYTLAMQTAFSAGVVPGREIKAEKQLDVLKNDSFEMASSRLFIDSFTDIGAQSTITESVNDDEILVSFSGIKDFPKLILIKNALNEALTGVGVAEERKLSRDQAILAVRSKKNYEELRKILVGFAGDPLHLKVSESPDHGNPATIKVEVR